MLANRPDHSVCFHDATSGLATAVANYIGEQLNSGSAALVLIRAERVGAVDAALIERGLEVSKLRLRGQLVIVAAEELLPRLVRAGELDLDAFQGSCAQQVQRLVAVFGSVRVYSELVDALEERGHQELALRLEEQWDKLQRDVAFDLLCGYDMARLESNNRASGFAEVCTRHSDVYGAERPSSVTGVRSRAAILSRERVATSFERPATSYERTMSRDPEPSSHQRPATSRDSEPSSHDHSTLIDITPFAPRTLEEQAGPLTAGRLLNVVLHDIGNVIATIRWSAADIRNSLPESSDAHEALNDILEAVDRCTSLSHDVLGLSRRRAPSVAQPLDEAVGGLSRLLRRAASSKVQFELTLDCGLCVQVSQCELTQLLINLVVNARHAVSAGGHIAVRTHQRVGVEGFDSGERVAIIEVTDDGVGMRVEDMKRIFDEHHSSRPNAEGNGLGLSIVRAIVDKYDGRIEVESAPNEGSCFRVYLRTTSQSS